MGSAAGWTAAAAFLLGGAALLVAYGAKRGAAPGDGSDDAALDDRTSLEGRLADAEARLEADEAKVRDLEGRIATSEATARRALAAAEEALRMAGRGATPAVGEAPISAEALEAALRDFEAGLKGKASLDERFVVSYCLLADACLRDGNAAKAREALERGLRVFPGNATLAARLKALNGK